MTDLAYAVRFGGSPDAAVTAIGEALQRRGFGVLATLHVDTILREKIQQEIEPLILLEVCSPRHAYRALTAVPDVALLLPCKIVVRRRRNETEVVLLRPEATIGTLLDQSSLRTIAKEVETVLRAVLDEVGAPPPRPA
ncbi:Uncharacterized conserved protein UCP021774 [mine drainage metagenome]|uniref:Uncharacterized conserved protein UCP021774 n=1 Tax=mine drainage metagenome TaxID=410659 RepID=T1C7K1_9ZZZZ